jgi:membrane protease YdiL (CAAX protease family)
LEPQENPIRKPIKQASSPSRIWLYVLLEGGLAVLGAGLAWAAGFKAFSRPSGEVNGSMLWPVIWGVAAGIGCFAVMSALDLLSWSPFARLRELVERALTSMLHQATTLQLAALAAAAGIGEEVLFRGFLQQGLADALGRMQVNPVIGQWAAIGIAALIFGLCHALSKTYLIAATLIGALLGYLYLSADHILAPIVAHGLYDFIAILYFVRSKRAQ